MNPKPDLLQIITALKNDASGGGIIRRRVDPASSIDVYLGIEPATRHVGVLLRVKRRLVPPARDLPDGAGFALKTHVIKDDAGDTINLGIFCTDPACEDVFRHFMDDVIPRLLIESGPESALRAFLTRVSLWQRFFVRGQSSYLSEEAQVGLFGELLQLRDLVIPAIGPAGATESWKGPEGKPQDYLLCGGALEVKSTRAKAGTRISIANEMQLDERPFAFLLLIHVSVTVAGGNNPSLPELVAEIRSLLPGPALSVFDDKLINAGYLDAHASHYRESRFFLRDVSYFDVRDGFPRIRSGDFPAGVVDIAYKIDPVALSPFRIDRSVVEGRLII